MNNGKKRPPADVNELFSSEAKEEPVERGTLNFTNTQPPRSGKSSGGFLPAALGAFFAFGLSAALLLTFAAPKNDLINFYNEYSATEEVVEQHSTAIAELQGMASSVETAVVEAQSAKNALENYVTKDQLPADIVTQSSLNPRLDSLQARLDALETAIEEKQEAEAESESGFADTTRWSVDFASDPVLPPEIRVLIDSERIEDPGIYEIELILENRSETDPYDLNSIFYLYFLPRDYVQVDEDETYLDTDRSPFISWRPDFEIRQREGKDVCRRIEFESEEEFIGTIDPGDDISFDLVFELSYLED